MDLEVDTTQQGWGAILTHDSKGLPLDRIRLLERLILAEVTWIYLEWKMDNKVAAPLLQTLIHGFKGYENYTDEEMVAEWQRIDSSFYKAAERGELHYLPPPFDPIHDWIKQQPRHSDVEVIQGPAAGG